MAEAQAPASSTFGQSKSFWMRVDAGAGRLSDAFRVKLTAPEGDWQVALAQDLKEELLEQFGSAFPSPSPPPLPWVFLWVPPKPQTAAPPTSAAAEAGEGKAVGGWAQLAATSSLGSLPAGVGSPDWPLVARLSPPPSAGGKPAAPRRVPRTLFEKGIAGPDEPEQIKNATELTELYPGGVLPRHGPNDFDLPVVLKLLLVAAILLAIGTGGMYLLGEVLPKLVQPQRPGEFAAQPLPSTPQSHVPSSFKIAAVLTGNGGKAPEDVRSQEQLDLLAETGGSKLEDLSNTPREEL